MKRIQIKIDKTVATFNNEAEVISFMASRLANKRNRLYKSDLIQAAKRMKSNQNCSIAMTSVQTKAYLLNEQD
ncbi:hypothetical protein FACS1894166_06610 [Bacilli bacterium]|nr:hypothetical protein FACS1894166_06610 [Bacilli bacterium]